MTKEYTCIVCPNGCEILADCSEGIENVKITGASCKRGEAYVMQELTDPRRTISTSVAVKDGVLPIVSVRLTKPVPLGKIRETAEQIHKIVLDAPVKSGTVILENIAGTDSCVITTKSVDRVLEH